MKNIVVGCGEIGKAVGAVLGEHHVIDLDFRSLGLEATYDYMHICIPYTHDFVSIVDQYINTYTPKLVIIWSTIPIGTTKQIPRAAHSPVEGVHPELEMSIRFMERWVGYNDEDLKFHFSSFFNELGLRVKMIPDSNFTEALKLLSTTEYGVNLVFADYKARIAEEIGMDFKLTQEWNQEYNKLYSNLGMGKRYQKYVLTDPHGQIGGHCVVPNAKILKNYKQNPLLDEIIKMEIRHDI